MFVTLGGTMKKGTFVVLLLLMVAGASGCSTSTTPLERLKRELAKYPEFSILLEDMKEEGNFFKEYFHRYKIVRAEAPAAGSPAGSAENRKHAPDRLVAVKAVQGQDEGGEPDLTYRTEITDWYEVSAEEYEKDANYLGMVLVSKSRDGKVADAPAPPGYQYVGNPRYGRWRAGSNGNSFWEFYGKYAFFSHMFGMFNRPIYRSDWNSYRVNSSRGVPYFGRNNQYGTHGTNTKYTNRSFFQRQQARTRARQSRFSDRVRSRVGRSRSSGVRSRSRGFGK